MKSRLAEKNNVELIFVRHGETFWNTENRVQGHLDSPLTNRGIAQAETIAQRFTDEQIDVFYSSDLGRASHTARIIANTIGIEVCADARLRERNLGIFQGLTYAEMSIRFPVEFALFETRDPAWRIPEGESGEDVKVRLTNFLNEIDMLHAGARIGIVTHGGILDMLIRLTFGLPLSGPRAFSLFNGSLNRFSLKNGRLGLLTWGDISHLLTAVGDDPTYSVKSL
ncbi:MAG: histidine phosphatase family protein [Candidatus Riflebacteria bacterium]|nr:histidine phosphatase family protein [Candidatus Riflebacteria bacterium]